MSNEINLTFAKTLNSLAGFDYGVQIYDEQLKGKIDLTRDFTLVFPEQIEIVASSFVQGLLSEIVDNIGLLSTENKLHIKARDEKLAERIMDKIK